MPGPINNPNNYRNSTSPNIAILDLITSNYDYYNKKYYIEYGVNGTTYCNDYDHLNGVETNHIEVTVDLNVVQNIWFQVVSQCHQTSAGNKGFWWKADVSNVDPYDPGVVFNDLYYMYMTNGCLANGQDYGCGSNDNH